MNNNISIGKIYSELENMTPLERATLLATTNPLKEMARKKREETWLKIREYIDNRIEEKKADYQNDYGVGYVEMLREDKVALTITETKEFDKLIDEYFEWSI